MGRVYALVRGVKRLLGRSDKLDSGPGGEATATSTTPSLSGALVLNPGTDPYLTRVSNANVSPADIPVETGFTPKEYIEYAVSTEAGRLTRQAIVDHTDWAPSVVDRLLSEMVEQRRIVLVSRGRITIVCLPNAISGQPSEGESHNEKVDARGDPVEGRQGRRPTRE